MQWCEFHLNRHKKKKVLYWNEKAVAREIARLSLQYPEKTFRSFECKNYNAYHLTTSAQIPEATRERLREKKRQKARRWKANVKRRHQEEREKLMAEQAAVGDTSDGFHTFNELYAHRRALTAALCKSSVVECWRSKKHHPEDSPMYLDYFIVGIELLIGLKYETITYHYPLEYWDDFYDVDEMDHAPKWDGADADKTVERLLQWKGGMP